MIRKFESFDEKLYKEIVYGDDDTFDLLYTKFKSEKVSDKEFSEIGQYFRRETGIKSFFKDIERSGSFIDIKFMFVNIHISKKVDEWWYVSISWDLSGRKRCFKCDTLQGIFNLFDSNELNK